MANRLEEGGLFVFDQDHASDGKIEPKKPITIFLSIVGNRFALMAVAFVALGCAILIMTIALQFSGAAKANASSDTGVPRQYTVTSPRGDIVDGNGIVLASSEEVNTFLLANAEMEEQELNKMLLELSYLFDQYNATTVSGLTDYFSVEPFAFLKTDEQVAIWQTSKNLFELKEAAENVMVTYSDDYVKSDPQVFFLYLRYKFNIDGKYTKDEAFRIIKLRYQIFADNWAFKTGTPVKIATDVPEELVSLVLEQNYKYQGIIASKDYRRIYSPLAKYSSHVVGYVGNISQERLAELKDLGYNISDIIGQAGIESQMERYLKGQIGQKAYNIWTKDQSDGAFYSEEMGIDPVPGADVYLTIDSNIQQVGNDAIKQYIEDAANSKTRKPGYKTASAGAFVVLDVKNGEIIAMNSYPDFNPNDFVLAMEGDVNAKEQLEYYLGVGKYLESGVTEQDLPLWNRAIMSPYTPGSTFKLVTALAALENGIITPNSSIYKCESPVMIAELMWKCLERPNGGHGNLTLKAALATSCNIYFQKLGVDTGIDNIDAIGKKLGLGEMTGIDLPGEEAGVRASKQTKLLLHESEFDKIWMPADTAQTAIGQFDNNYTILQLARYTAAIATNQLVTPHVIREVVAEDGTVLYSGSTDVIPLDFSEENLDAIRAGMLAVANGEDPAGLWQGTAFEYFDNFKINGKTNQVACKTGTAETGWENIRKEYSNGLFICYAPADDPQIAIALVVEKGEWGSSTAKIAKKILEAYFEDSGDVDVTSANPIIGDDLTELAG